MTGSLRPLAVTGGVVLVVLVVSDAISTLIVTQGRTSLSLRDKAEAWARLQELREPYGNRLEEVIDYLLAPHGFWGHSAEATVADEVSRAAREARHRGRRSS